MELKIQNGSNEAAGSIEVSDALFAREYNEPLIHQLVVSFMANARSGTRAQKARGDLTRSHSCLLYTSPSPRDRG